MNYNVADVLSLAKATMKIHGLNVSATMDAIHSVKGIEEKDFDLIERALIEIRIKELGLSNKDILKMVIADSCWYRQQIFDDDNYKDETMYDDEFGRVKVRNFFAVVFDLLDC